MAPWDFLLVAAKLLSSKGKISSVREKSVSVSSAGWFPSEGSWLCHGGHGGLRTVRKVWIGLEDIVVEGEFQWTTSQEMPEYTSWQDGQPSDSGDGEDCGEIFDDGSWNDVACDDPIQKRGFICERN
nr:hypothetical protein BaRGS_009259 [Batillaria attramentaria]